MRWPCCENGPTAVIATLSSSWSSWRRSPVTSGSCAGSRMANADAADQLIELAAERGDLEGLRRLSDRGNSAATDQLIETAGELGMWGAASARRRGQHHRGRGTR